MTGASGAWALAPHEGIDSRRAERHDKPFG